MFDAFMAYEEQHLAGGVTGDRHGFVRSTGYEAGNRGGGCSISFEKLAYACWRKARCGRHTRYPVSGIRRESVPAANGTVCRRQMADSLQTT
jgi:hypothetical protein